MADSKQKLNVSKTAERILWFGGLLCFGVGSFTVLNALKAKHTAEQHYYEHVPSVPQETAEETHIEGRIEVSALHLSAPILSDCSDSALRLGSCHVKGTATAGGLGNMGIAGHRDGTFRSVRNIQNGQVIDVFGADGHFQYAVDTTTVVPADDVSVLAIREQPELTLITCFPFNYVGAAPKRFIVHAHLVSVQAE